MRNISSKQATTTTAPSTTTLDKNKSGKSLLRAHTAPAIAYKSEPWLFLANILSLQAQACGQQVISSVVRYKLFVFLLLYRLDFWYKICRLENYRTCWSSVCEWEWQPIRSSVFRLNSRIVWLFIQFIVRSCLLCSFFPTLQSNPGIRLIGQRWR